MKSAINPHNSRTKHTFHLVNVFTQYSCISRNVVFNQQRKKYIS